MVVINTAVKSGVELVAKVEGEAGEIVEVHGDDSWVLGLVS